MSTETSKTDLLREQFDRYVIPNYSRFPLTIVRGEGSYVWDADGNRYLDLFPGWGCNLLGHCPPAVVQAVGPAGARTDSCAEHLLHNITGPLGTAAFGAILWRSGVFL